MRSVGHFFPDFLIPPDARGPLPAALAAISFIFFCSSCCLKNKDNVDSKLTKGIVIVIVYRD